MSIQQSPRSFFSGKHDLFSTLLSALRNRGKVYASGALLAILTISFCSCKGDGHEASVDPLTRILYPPPPKQSKQAEEIQAEPGIAHTSEMQVAANTPPVPEPQAPGKSKSGSSWWGKKAPETFPESRTAQRSYVNPYLAARQPEADFLNAPAPSNPAEMLYQASPPVYTQGTSGQITRIHSYSQDPAPEAAQYVPPLQPQMASGMPMLTPRDTEVKIAMVPSHATAHTTAHTTAHATAAAPSYPAYQQQAAYQQQQAQQPALQHAVYPAPSHHPMASAQQQVQQATQPIQPASHVQTYPQHATQHVVPQAHSGQYYYAPPASHPQAVSQAGDTSHSMYSPQSVPVSQTQQAQQGQMQGQPQMQHQLQPQMQHQAQPPVQQYIQPQGTPVMPTMPNGSIPYSPYQQPTNDPLRGRYVETPLPESAPQPLYRPVTFVQDAEPADEADEEATDLSDEDSADSGDSATTVKKK